MRKSITIGARRKKKRWMHGGKSIRLMSIRRTWNHPRAEKKARWKRKYDRVRKRKVKLYKELGLC